VPSARQDAAPDLRCTTKAILWRHQNAAKWRSIPVELGPWWRAAQIFIRGTRLGVWERLLRLAQGLFLDGSNTRTHQKAAGAARKGAVQPSAIAVRDWGARAAVMAPKLV
jgi:transposase